MSKCEQSQRMPVVTHAQASIKRPPNKTCADILGQAKRESRASAGERPLKFAQANTVQNNRVENVVMTWAEFCARLAKPVRSNETLTHYLALPSDKQLALKDCGFWVSGHFDGGVRKGGNIGARDCLALDLDFAPADCLEQLSDEFMGLGEYAWVCHSTRKHTPERHRLRVVIPLTRSVNATEYQAVSRWLADNIGVPDERSIEWVDNTSFEFARVMFWPSVCSDGEYVLHINAGAWLNPDDVLSRYADPADVSAWPVSSRVKQALRDTQQRAGDPLAKPGIVGAFCRAYTIHEAIDQFIPGVYVSGAHDDRMTYAAGTSANGALVYDGGLFLYSHHESDPAYAVNCNAFDLIRLHKFGDLDAQLPRDTPIQEKPSHKRMAALAEFDDAVLLELKTAATERGFAVESEVQAEIDAASPDTLFLPNDHVPASLAAERIFRCMGETQELYRRGGAVVEIRNAELLPLTPSAFRSRLDKRSRKVRAFKTTPKQGLIHSPKLCSDDVARLLLSCSEVELLPPVVLVCRLPILIEDGEGNLITTRRGYNEVGGGVLVTESLDAPTVSTNQAVRSLVELLKDFNFTTPADKARALASMVAPALRMGGLIAGDALMTCVEADQSQTGKGYLLKLIREIYGEQPYTITKRQGGVGSLDESLGQALLSGRPFISLDNLRGKLDSQFLESALTARGDLVSVRVPHRGEVSVDISRVLIQLTSNGIEATDDASNRMLMVRLLKQSPGYQFATFEGRSLLQHVEAHRGHYLGCVHAVVRYWHDNGAPQTNSGHTFREWAGSLDWIVQNVFRTGPLLDGHEAARSRVANPALSWLRRLAHALASAGVMGRELLANELYSYSQDLDVPMPGDPGSLAPDVGARRVGAFMAQCFRDNESVDLDGIRATRIERDRWDAISRHARVEKRYLFERE